VAIQTIRDTLTGRDTEQCQQILREGERGLTKVSRDILHNFQANSIRINRLMK
jgi:hypothetical protein